MFVLHNDLSNFNLDKPFKFQIRMEKSEEILELRKANEIAFHEKRMANLDALHNAEMEVVALKKQYFQQRIAMLNSKFYIYMFSRLYGISISLKVSPQK